MVLGGNGATGISSERLVERGKLRLVASKMPPALMLRAVANSRNVTSQNYSLTNSGGASLPWSVVGIPTWLNVAPAAGTLPTSGSTTVSVSLNATANTLGAGVYAATLSFSNQTTHVTQNRSFALTVLAPNVVQNGGFEAGLGFTNWTVSNNDGFNYVDNGSLTHGFISPHSHNFCGSCNRVRLTTEGRLLPHRSNQNRFQPRT